MSCSHRRYLIDSKSLHFPRTLLSNLAEINNAVVLMVSARVPISSTSSPLSSFWGHSITQQLVCFYLSKLSQRFFFIWSPTWDGLFVSQNPWEFCMPLSPGQICIIIIIIIIIIIRVFTAVWVTTSLLKSPGLFSVFWPFSIMLLFGWSSLVRQSMSSGPFSNPYCSKSTWCNGYRLWKWTRRHEFKSWTRLIAFHIALIPSGKVWI